MQNENIYWARYSNAGNSIDDRTKYFDGGSMIGSYSCIVDLLEYKSSRVKPSKEIIRCQKNVVKCNRFKKLSYCKGDKYGSDDRERSK